jgi:hypothetical protein
MRRTFTMVGVLALALSLLALPALAMTASAPVSDGGVTPYIIDGANPGGNRTCAEVGQAFFGDPNYYQYSSERVNYEGGMFDQSFPAGITVDYDVDEKLLSWSSTFGIGAVIVKGSNDANVYVYEPQSKGDSGLGAPETLGGPGADLSNLTFCWNPTPGEGEWCSPGFWSQNPENAAAAAELGGFTLDSTLSEVGIAYTPTKQQKNRGAETDPTIAEVLAAPNVYGGEVFNAVGDLLSEAAGLEFDERIEDSCPFAADASGKPPLTRNNVNSGELGIE